MIRGGGTAKSDASSRRKRARDTKSRLRTVLTDRSSAVATSA